MLLYMSVMLLIATIDGISIAQAAVSNDMDELLNWCLDAKNHKTKPGPEDALHKQCSPWKERSCCTYNTTYESHYMKSYNFDWDHCSEKKKLSKECRKYFIQDLCFYECSPNVGPWVVKVKQKLRKEKFFEVPLCASDCDAWFKACEDDYTCTDNWGFNFDWINGTNVCPKGSKCRTYREIYKSSANFCEKVWDYSWKYTEDRKPCFRLWFNGSEGNPNTAVARLLAAKIVASLSAEKLLGNVSLLTLSLANVIFTYMQYRDWFQFQDTLL